jgi:pSer/pThr/pTyr-binding forkhead associated (FHA) protein
MILCPNCRNQELSGALFCSECGARLVVLEVPTTHSIERNQTGLLMFQPRPSSPPPGPVTVTTNQADAVVSLHLIESGMILHLSGQNEFTLGRVAEGQPILPDVDLSPYEAYAQGVSRLHSSLKLNNQRVFITDLGSSNGTRVNGQKIMPNVDYPINHGDVVALGKFKIQVLIRK